MPHSSARRRRLRPERHLPWPARQYRTPRQAWASSPAGADRQAPKRLGQVQESKEIDRDLALIVTHGHVGVRTSLTCDPRSECGVPISSWVPDPVKSGRSAPVHSSMYSISVAAIQRTPSPPVAAPQIRLSSTVRRGPHALHNGAPGSLHDHAAVDHDKLPCHVVAFV